MPTVLYVTDWKIQRSGIAIAWTRTSQKISVSGWYDSCVGIEGQDFSLREFLDALGITKRDCEKSFKEEK